jgi:diketogulonate reductase-like aldo/keto reductase
VIDTAVTAPLLGFTKPHHLTDAVAALDVHLNDEQVKALEEPYGTHLAAAVGIGANRESDELRTNLYQRQS